LQRRRRWRLDFRNARGLPYYIDMEERDYMDYNLCTDGILQIYKDLLYIV
jgi:hypothetical protein